MTTRSLVRTRHGAAPTRAKNLVPPMDVFRSDDGLLIAVDLPGVATDALKVRIENDRLEIEGARPDTAIWKRSLGLPKRVDATGIAATFEAGVLSLVLPWREDTRPREVPITVG